MKKNHGVSLIIPTFNEEKTIENVISRCLKQTVVTQIVVVNDGSTDKTKALLEKLSKKYSKLFVINHQYNLGKGAAIQSGLTKTKGKYVMIQDADLEYFPEDINSLYDLAEHSKNGIIFGTRSFQRKKGYLLAQIGNWYLNVLFNFLFNFTLTDTYTCYKLMPKTVWQNLKLESTGFEIDSEIVAKLGLNNYKITESLIKYQPRKYSEGKKIIWIDVIKATSVALKIKLRGYIHP